MANRYTRDQLLYRALDMADVPTLDSHDRPSGGRIVPDAFCITWMQDLLDLLYNEYPWATAVTSALVSITANSQDIVKPSDFVLDVRNGLLVTINNKKKRARRKSFQQWLNRDLFYQGQTALAPYWYTFQGTSIRITPTPSVSQTATLWYYKLPPTLSANDIPTFPSDYMLIEYIRIRAWEWCRRYDDPGVALKFAAKAVSALRSTGLAHEPEDDEIPFDDEQFDAGLSTTSIYSWLGDIGTNP